MSEQQNLTLENLQKILKEAVSIPASWAKANKIDKRNEIFKMPNSRMIEVDLDQLIELAKVHKEQSAHLKNYIEYKKAIKKMRDALLPLLALDKPFRGGKIFKNQEDLEERLLNSQGLAELREHCHYSYLNIWKKGEPPFNERNLTLTKKRFPESEGYEVTLTEKGIMVNHKDEKPVDLSHNNDVFLTPEEEEEIFKKYSYYNLDHSSGLTWKVHLAALLKIWMDLVPEAIPSLEPKDKKALDAFVRFLEGIVPYISNDKPKRENIKKEIENILPTLK